jgi:hypothetical protein
VVRSLSLARAAPAQFPRLTRFRTAPSARSPTEGVDSRKEIGQAWLLSSKIARKAGHSQTAYSAVLQARQYATPFTFVQDAKLLYSTGQNLRALQELQNSLKPILESKSLRGPDLAKVSLLPYRAAAVSSTLTPAPSPAPGCAAQSPLDARHRALRQQRGRRWLQDGDLS